MKVAIYIAENRLQVILTPEIEQEKEVLKLVAAKEIVKVYRGDFYGCQGGYNRWATQDLYSNYTKCESLILVLDTPVKADDSRQERG